MSLRNLIAWCLLRLLFPRASGSATALAIVPLVASSPDDTSGPGPFWPGSVCVGPWRPKIPSRYLADLQGSRFFLLPKHPPVDKSKAPFSGRVDPGAFDPRAKGALEAATRANGKCLLPSDEAAAMLQEHDAHGFRVDAPLIGCAAPGQCRRQSPSLPVPTFPGRDASPEPRPTSATHDKSAGHSDSRESQD